MPAGPARAFRIFADSISGQTVRWDAAPRLVTGEERSLDQGLRYSVSGGSYDAFRDEFTWAGGTPTSENFQAAVEGAFGVWTEIDTASGGLPASFGFVSDFTTAVVEDDITDFFQTYLGAEIDLIAATTSPARPGDIGWTEGSSLLRGASGLGIDLVNFDDITLTSGTTDYAGYAIAGADIRMNSNPEAVWTLDEFQNLLSHEIGHALGLADVDLFDASVATDFIDDNYDGSSSATALATLTNPFAGLIDPLDPNGSALLSEFLVADGDPGVDTPGVEILMESAHASETMGLSNDDFAGRQFLYPTLVPEPSTGLLVQLGLVGLAVRRRFRSAASG